MVSAAAVCRPLYDAEAGPVVDSGGGGHNDLVVSAVMGLRASAADSVSALAASVVGSMLFRPAAVPIVTPYDNVFRGYFIIT